MTEKKKARKQLNDFPEVLTIKEASEFLGVNTFSLYRWVKQGKIPARKVSAKKWLLSKTVLLNFLAGGFTIPLEKLDKSFSFENAEKIIKTLKGLSEHEK